jgi:hypothetical protein
MHRWHGIAAVLTGVALGRTRHRFTALHRLFWRGHGQAVKAIGRKSDNNQRQENWPDEPHRFLD